ncbi:MAG: HAD-IA family hydrolase [Thermomicrobiales bacterium]
MNGAPEAVVATSGLLCDLDGVVRLWPAHIVANAEDAAGLPRGSVHATAFAADLLPLAVTGRISDEVWRAEVTDRLRAAHPEADARGAVAGWSASPGVINQPVLDLLRQRRVPLALVTNATTRLPADLAALGLASEFDHIINSSRIRIAKPERGIFEAALQGLDLAATQVLFVDDDARHVAAAAELGMRSYQFQGDVTELGDVLREAGVLPE